MQGRAGEGRSVSLVIPAYNEEAGIAAAIAEADEALARLAHDCEILVVDDGSRDDTFGAAIRAATNRPRVRVIRHEQNRGYGAALRTGFEAARCDRVAFTDADCQFYLDDLGDLLPHAERVPIVVGYRIDRQDPWRRRFLSRGYNRIVRTLLGTRVRDCDCAMKVFRRDALHHILPSATNFFVNTEMLTRARQHRLAIAEVGVRHRPRTRGHSSVSLTDVPRTLATLLPFWWSNVMFPARRVTPSPSRGVVDMLLVLAIALVLFFSRLGTPLQETSEVRFAEMARQHRESGAGLTSAFRETAFDPPLMTWSVRAAYDLFGVQDRTARLVPGIAGLLTVCIAWVWVRLLAGRRAALIGAVMLMLTPGFLFYQRLLTPLALVTLCTTATLAFGHLAMLAESRRRWLLVGGTGFAAGLLVLAGGPVALILPIPPLVVLALLDRRVTRLRRKELAGVVLTLTATGGPWFLAEWGRSPENAMEPWRAGMAWIVAPGSTVAMLLAIVLPWGLLGPALLRDVIRHDAASGRPAALGVFLLAIGWGAALFVLSGFVGMGLLIAMIPAMSLSLAIWIDARLPDLDRLGLWTTLVRSRSVLAFRCAAAALIAGIAAALATLSAGMNEPSRGIAIVGMGGGALVILVIGQRTRRTSWATAAGCSLIMMLAGVQALLPEHANQRSLRHPINMYAWHATATDSPMVCYPRRFDSIAFYSRCDDIRSFELGEEDELAHVLRTQRSTLLFVDTAHLPTLLEILPPELEFVAYSRGDVVIGEMRPRREALHWRLAKAPAPLIIMEGPNYR